MDLLGGPAAELQAALEENLQEANDARIVELDAGIELFPIRLHSLRS